MKEMEAPTSRRTVERRAVPIEHITVQKCAVHILYLISLGVHTTMGRGLISAGRILYGIGLKHGAHDSAAWRRKPFWCLTRRPRRSQRRI